MTKTVEEMKAFIVERNLQKLVKELVVGLGVSVESAIETCYKAELEAEKIRNNK